MGYLLFCDLEIPSSCSILMVISFTSVDDGLDVIVIVIVMSDVPVDIYPRVREIYLEAVYSAAIFSDLVAVRTKIIHRSHVGTKIPKDLIVLQD